MNVNNKQEPVIEQRSISIQSPDSSGQSVIKLAFEQHGDRWTHRWSAATETHEFPFLKSHEGLPDQIWPPSPPLQDVSQHALEHGDAVLCVGMAGTSHWSASYSIEKSGNRIWVKSDLACLQKGLASSSGDSSSNDDRVSLLSTYEIDSACKIDSSTSDRIELVSSMPNLNTQQRVVLKAFSGEGIETAFELTDRTLCIKPREISKSPVVPTRWGFHLEIAT